MAEANVTMREYETIYVLKPDLEDAKIIEVEEKLRTVVQQSGGKSIKINNLGKRKLSYEVDKLQKGVYVHHTYLASPAIIKDYERVLKLADEALLYQTIKLTEEVDPESRSAEEDQLLPPARENNRRDRDERGPSPRSDDGVHASDHDDHDDHDNNDRDDDDDDSAGDDLATAEEA